MGMKEFIADLEARAVLLPASVFPHEEYDFCLHCSQPLYKGRSNFLSIELSFEGQYVCEVCYELHQVMWGRVHFLKAQNHYYLQQGRKRLLFPDSNYFEGGC